MKILRKKTSFGTFHYTLYRRKKTGVYSFRVIHDQTKTIIATYSTHQDLEKKARLEATAQFNALDLEQIYRTFLAKRVQVPSPELRAHASKPKKSSKDHSTKEAPWTPVEVFPQSDLSHLYTVGELQNMTVGAYVQAFWDPQRSPYINDRINMRKPLSGKYVHDNQKNAKNYFRTDRVMRTLPIRILQYTDLEDFVRRLIVIGKTPYMLRHILDTLRPALTWGSLHTICDSISFKKLPIPEPEEDHPRGILNDDEFNRIFDLDAIPIWFTKDGAPHISVRPTGKKLTKEEEDNPVIFLREKLYVLLGLFLGLRKGELRALRWSQIDFENRLISIKENVVPLDPIKEPKTKSQRIVVLPQRLLPILEEAYATAKILDAADPDSFVLINERDSHQPVGDNISDAWVHILRAIGISKEEQESRHLVFHGTRHFYVTKLLDAGLSPHQVGKLSGHRVLKTIERYGDHTTQEALERAKVALNQ